jgi:hypothetical protein
MRVELFLPVQGIFPNRKSVVKDYSFIKLKGKIVILSKKDKSLRIGLRKQRLYWVDGWLQPR